MRPSEERKLFKATRVVFSDLEKRGCGDVSVTTDKLTRKVQEGERSFVEHELSLDHWTGTERLVAKFEEIWSRLDDDGKRKMARQASLTEMARDVLIIRDELFS